MRTPIELIDFKLTFRTDVDDAPKRKIIMAWGNGGWRFVRRDEEGNWRTMYGAHTGVPKRWSEVPKEAEEDPQ